MNIFPSKLQFQTWGFSISFLAYLVCKDQDFSSYFCGIFFTSRSLDCKKSSRALSLFSLRKWKSDLECKCQFPADYEICDLAGFIKLTLYSQQLSKMNLKSNWWDLQVLWRMILFKNKNVLWITFPNLSLARSFSDCFPLSHKSAPNTNEDKYFCAFLIRIML